MRSPSSAWLAWCSLRRASLAWSVAGQPHRRHSCLAKRIGYSVHRRRRPGPLLVCGNPLCPWVRALVEILRPVGLLLREIGRGVEVREPLALGAVIVQVEEVG